MPLNPQRKLSAAGLALTKTEEGLRKAKYLDQTGHWTIGYGHLLHPEELASGYIQINGQACWFAGHGLWLSDCEHLLDQDMDWAEATINAHVNVPLLQCQFDALCDFVFNVGNPHFEGSELLKFLNQGKIDLVPDELRKWTFSSGKKLPVLVARREHEITLWRGNA